MSALLHQITLREGGVQDLGSVQQIMQQAFDPLYGEAWTKAQCMGMMSLSGVWLVIASMDGVDCGFALARAMLDEAELLLLATRASVRRKGVGGALLRAVIAEARHRGAATIHLEVRAGNGAVKLYQREGFEKVGERPGYYRGTSGKPLDAWTFSHKLI